MGSPTDSMTSAALAENDELPSSEEGEEEILLDENAEAAKHSFYIVGALETSPDHKLLAYAEDTTGGEKYTLHVRELATGKQLLKRPIEVCFALLFRGQISAGM